MKTAADWPIPVRGICGKTQRVISHSARPGVRNLQCAGAWALLFGTAVAAEPELLREAQQALAESVPQVAIQKLNRFLTAADLPADERVAGARILGEALLAAGEHERAIAVVQPFADQGDAASRLLLADALAAAGRWREALPLYREAAAKPGAALAAHMGEAEALHATGQTAKAIDKLETRLREGPRDVAVQLRLAALLLETRELGKVQAVLKGAQPVRVADVKWKKYLEGRLLLAQDQPAPALVTFQEIVRDRRHLSENLLVGATFGITEASIAMHGYEAADRVLEKFISDNENSSLLELVFQRLDEVYAHEEDPPERKLHDWAKSPAVRRAALARYYVARLQLREKKYGKAAVSLDAFVYHHPSHPLLPYAHLMRADLCMTKSDLAAALLALEAASRHANSDELRAEIELRTGLVHFRAGEYLLAGNTFDLAAKRSPKLRESALYNSALAAMHQKNFDRFEERYRELSGSFPGSELRSQLLLEEGLVQARHGDPRAVESLRIFAREFPRHSRMSEARLALAELAFQAGDSGSTARYLRVANNYPSSTEMNEHAQYLSIFLADGQTPRADASAIELGQKFIRERPHSPLLPEVRMKLGQIYFRESDFPSAETQFATLARENPASPYAEKALFLAGQAAMKTINPGAIDRALDFFDQVVKRDGELKLPARQQQAIVQGLRGKESEAVTLYDIILVAQPPPEPELRFAALCGKGDNLVALGRSDPKQLEAAIAVFEQLAASKEVTSAWRNQALYKKAKALDQLNRTAEALVAFYDVLNQGTDRDEGGREYFWYYKAGFDAARIFETQEQWKSALGIYAKMAAFDGPRAAEARASIRELRLKHFIWE